MSDPLTSTLLWVSSDVTVSPLHFDLNEGILAQLHGVKHVTLADPRFYDELYPHAVSDAHDRQSRVDCIDSPGPAFPLARRVPLLRGDLTAGSVLYLPFGWWHQLESGGASISVSMRWNPHAEAVQQLATAWHVTAQLPDAVRQRILAPQLQSLPTVVASIHQRRWTELAREKAASGGKASGEEARKEA